MNPLLRMFLMMIPVMAASSAARYLMRASRVESKENIVFYPSLVPKIASIMLVLCSAFWMYIFFVVKKIYAIVSITMFLVLLAVIFVETGRKIFYTSTGFTVIGALGRKRDFSYEDITGITDEDDMILRVGRKKIWLHQHMLGRKKFVQAIRKFYIQNVKGSRYLSIEKSHLFKGNVKSPTTLVAVWIVFLVGTLSGMMIVTMSDHTWDDFSPPGMEQLELTYKNHYMQQHINEATGQYTGSYNVIIETYEENKPIILYGYDEERWSMYPQFDGEIRDGKTIQVSVVLRENAAGEYWNLYYLSVESEEYLTKLDRFNSYWKSGIVRGLKTAAVLISMICFLGAFFTVIVNNADKLPRLAVMMVGKDHLRNPIARQKLGLPPLKEE